METWHYVRSTSYSHRRTSYNVLRENHRIITQKLASVSSATERHNKARNPF